MISLWLDVVALSLLISQACRGFKVGEDSVKLIIDTPGVFL
jgi:hypothetical protein